MSENISFHERNANCMRYSMDSLRTSLSVLSFLPDDPSDDEESLESTPRVQRLLSAGTTHSSLHAAVEQRREKPFIRPVHNPSERYLVNFTVDSGDSRRRQRLLFVGSREDTGLGGEARVELPSGTPLYGENDSTKHAAATYTPVKNIEEVIASARAVLASGRRTGAGDAQGPEPSSGRSRKVPSLENEADPTGHNQSARVAIQPVESHHSPSKSLPPSDSFISSDSTPGGAEKEAARNAPLEAPPRQLYLSSSATGEDSFVHQPLTPCTPPRLVDSTEDEKALKVDQSDDSGGEDWVGTIPVEHQQAAGDGDNDDLVNRWNAPTPPQEEVKADDTTTPGGGAEGGGEGGRHQRRRRSLELLHRGEVGCLRRPKRMPTPPALRRHRVEKKKKQKETGLQGSPPPVSTKGILFLSQSPSPPGRANGPKSGHVDASTPLRAVETLKELPSNARRTKLVYDDNIDEEEGRRRALSNTLPTPHQKEAPERVEYRYAPHEDHMMMSEGKHEGERTRKEKEKSKAVDDVRVSKEVMRGQPFAYLDDMNSSATPHGPASFSTTPPSCEPIQYRHQERGPYRRASGLSTGADATDPSEWEELRALEYELEEKRLALERRKLALIRRREEAERLLVQTSPRSVVNPVLSKDDGELKELVDVERDRERAQQAQIDKIKALLGQGRNASHSRREAVDSTPSRQQQSVPSWIGASACKSASASELSSPGYTYLSYPDEKRLSDAPLIYHTRPQKEDELSCSHSIASRSSSSEEANRALHIGIEHRQRLSESASAREESLGSSISEKGESSAGPVLCEPDNNRITTLRTTKSKPTLRLQKDHVASEAKRQRIQNIVPYDPPHYFPLPSQDTKANPAHPALRESTALRSLAVNTPQEGSVNRKKPPRLSMCSEEASPWEDEPRESMLITALNSGEPRKVRAKSKNKMQPKQHGRKSVQRIPPNDQRFFQLPAESRLAQSPYLIRIGSSGHRGG